MGGGGWGGITDNNKILGHLTPNSKKFAPRCNNKNI